MQTLDFSLSYEELEFSALWCIISEFCFLFKFLFLSGWSVKMFRVKYYKGSNDREAIVLSYFPLVKGIIILKNCGVKY